MAENDILFRLTALDCPEKGTRKGTYAKKVTEQFEGAKMTCELTGAKTYDRIVGYRSVDNFDFGRYMTQNSSSQFGKNMTFATVIDGALLPQRHLRLLDQPKRLPPS